MRASTPRSTAASGAQVRSSGIKLLFDIMTRHSAALVGEERRVWDMAFPLLLEVARQVQSGGGGGGNGLPEAAAPRPREVRATARANTS